MKNKEAVSAEDFKRVLRPGTVEVWKSAGKGYAPLFLKFEFMDGRLSVTGIEGPRKNGDAWGSCGQCVDSLGRLVDLAPRWNRAMVERLRKTWRRWRLNDMRAGCEHQRALGWEAARIKPEEMPRCTANSDERGILAIWVYPEGTRGIGTEDNTHRDGLLTKPCPECGYKYGSAWLREEVPAEVLMFLRSLPEADTTPAWV